MKKIYLLFLILFTSSNFAQVVINELDSDTPGTDLLEFIELKSATPNFPLDGYVLVFYNGTSAGTNGMSYLAIDLDNYSTDVNGIIHFGNPLVSPTAAITITFNTVQNGPDGVALYLGDATDFPTNTIAHTNGLIDSFAYTNTNTSPIYPTYLMIIFGLTTAYYDSQPTGSTTKSMQRKDDGTFEYKTPTPGMNNDGSGIPLTYISMASTPTTLSEGQTLNITFTTSSAVTTSPLIINFALENGTFNPTDFSGSTTVTIPVGSTSATATIQVLDDGINDGDEELKIFVSGIQTGYSLYNNNVIIRVNDINYVTLPFGSPTNPTFGQVATTAPLGYYASIEGLSGAALKQGLQNIIANPSVVHGHNYGDIYDILKVADQNPENNNQVWLIYNEQPRSKIDIQTGNSIVGKWNREHIYCQSRGGFADATPTTPAGINVWTQAGPDIITTGHADAHHIRAVDGQENSSRNNRNYGVDYNGPTGNPGTWKGDVARSLFYMGVRYNGLQIVNGNPPDLPVGYIGDLATLLQWNHNDVADDFEMNRNNYIYTWQVNRNPFIDFPNLADYIYGSNYGQPWFAALATNSFEELKVSVYPNPAKNHLNISGITQEAKVDIYNMTGTKVLSLDCNQNTDIPLNFSSGIYTVRISSDNKSAIKRLVIE